MSERRARNEEKEKREEEEGKHALDEKENV